MPAREVQQGVPERSYCHVVVRPLRGARSEVAGLAYQNVPIGTFYERRGVTIVLIEHDMGLVMDISDRVVP